MGRRTAYQRWKRQMFKKWTLSDDPIPLWARLLWPTIHYCDEWDCLVIDKTCSEFDECRCFDTADDEGE